MIYRIYYREIKIGNPKGENIGSLYMEADSDVIVRQLVEEDTSYNIECARLLDEKYPAYEQEHASFTLMEF